MLANRSATLICHTCPMRKSTAYLFTLLAFAWPVAALANAPGDLHSLEQAWHGCVREAYASQPFERSKAAAQRVALDACRAHKDAYVAAEASTRVRAPRPFGTHVRAWVTSAAGSVVKPVKAWVGALRR
jgi:hypothetical protein